MVDKLILLLPFERKIRAIFESKGTRTARSYILRHFRIKLTGLELRMFLEVPCNQNHQDCHNLSWSVVGGCGELTPLSYMKGDDKRYIKKEPVTPRQVRSKICL